MKEYYWSEGAKGNDEGETLTVRFATPSRLDKVIILPGAFDKAHPEEFKKQPRPHQVLVTLKDAQGKILSSPTLTLDDDPDFQTRDLEGDNVSTVDFTIESVHPPNGGSDCSIAEIEFKRRT